MSGLTDLKAKVLGTATPIQGVDDPDLEISREGWTRRRPNRTTLGTRNVLTAPSRPGYVRRFINAVGNQTLEERVEEFKERGWRPVEDDIQVGTPRAGDPARLGSTVQKSVGGGRRAILVEIPEEWYAEDQKLKQSANDAIEDAIKNKEVRATQNARPASLEGLTGSVDIRR